MPISESTTQNCPICGKSFISYNGIQKYCSTECQMKNYYATRPSRAKAKQPKTCIVCGKTFVPISQKAKYCSDDCRKIAYSKKVIHTPKICAWCGKEFTPEQYQGQEYCCEYCKRRNELERDRERIYKYQRKYKRTQGKEMTRHYTTRRRTRQKNLLATLTIEEWRQCLEYFDYKDAYTGLPMKVISKDHVVPLSKGGGYTRPNIVPCENSVNNAKNDADFFEWYSAQPFFSEKRLKKILRWTGLKPNTEVQQISMF